MNALSFIRNAISRRITQLENECYLITQQMQFFAYTNSHEVDFLLLNYQLDNSVCKMYKLYLSEIQKLYMDVCPMKRAISCHLFVMKNFPLNSLLNEIICHQNALQELCNIDLKRSVDDLEAGVYIREHIKDKYMNIMVSEAIISFFNYDKILGISSNNLINFQFTENCRLMVQDKLKSLNINKDFLRLLEENQNVNKNVLQIKQNEILKQPQFDNDEESIIQPIRPVILELRKLTTKISASMIVYSLLKAMEYLNLILSFNGKNNIGADESFQFFVAAISEAQLHILPSLIFLLENFVLNELKTAKINFLITQLQVSHSFIQTRPIPVPPYLLFPFNKSKISDIELKSEEPIDLYGFEVYAFPSYLDKPFPALIYYTGDMSKCIPVYQFKSISNNNNDNQSNTKLSAIVQNFHAIPTILGTLMHIQVEEMNDEMILLDDSKFVESSKEISLFSNLLLMTCNKIKKPKLSYLPELLKIFKELWRVNDDIDLNEFVFEKVKIIQKILYDEHLIPKNYIINGIIDQQTINGVKEIVKGFRENEFFIDPKIYSYICKTKTKN